MIKIRKNATNQRIQFRDSVASQVWNFSFHQIITSFVHVTSICSVFVIDSATYLHSFTYGYGDKQIIADTWLITLENVVSYATVSRDGLCVPLNGNNFVSEPSK